MSVLLETSLGDITVDLLVDVAPKACEKYVAHLSHLVPPIIPIYCVF